MFWCFQILSSAMIKILRGLEKRKLLREIPTRISRALRARQMFLFVTVLLSPVLGKYCTSIEIACLVTRVFIFTFFYFVLRRPFKQSNLADHAMTPAYFYELENSSPWRKIRRVPTWPAKLLIMPWRFHRPSYFYTFSGCYSWMFPTLEKTNQLCKALTGR